MKTYKVTIDYFGAKRWYNQQNLLHNEEGPAVEYANGDKYWYINGKRHRENGPAVECASGTKLWYINDQFHRENGPAVEHADGYKAWYINNEQLTEEEFNKRSQSCEGKVVEIEGKKYILKSI